MTCVSTLTPGWISPPSIRPPSPPAPPEPVQSKIPSSVSVITAPSSPAWELYGKKGLVSDGFPNPNEARQDGTVSYHLREGKHNLTLHDWNRYMDFADRLGWHR